jgi:hypothetical protein
MEIKIRRANEKDIGALSKLFHQIKDLDSGVIARSASSSDPSELKSPFYSRVRMRMTIQLIHIH